MANLSVHRQRSDGCAGDPCSLAGASAQVIALAHTSEQDATRHPGASRKAKARGCKFCLGLLLLVWATFCAVAATSKRVKLVRPCGEAIPDFIECVRRHERTCAPVETAHRSTNLCSLGEISMRLRRKLV